MPSPTPPARPRPARCAAVGLTTLLLVAPVVLTGCGGTAQPVPAASDTSSPDVAEAPAEAPAKDSSDASPASDICALLTPEEVAAVLPGAVVAATQTMGSLSDDFGGQCIWTDSATGEIVVGETTQVELVVWQPDGINPAPPEAVPAGSSEIVPSGAGAYFAGPSQSLWLRLTGSQADDTAKIAAVQALAPLVQSRL